MKNFTFKKLAFTLASVFVVSSCSAQEDETQWRKLDPEHTVLLTLPQGKVVIELAPQFSPKHVAQFEKLSRAGFYENTKFYRVIDGFVAQAGPEDESEKDKSVPILKIEEEWQTDKNFIFSKVQDNDMFAEQTGFKDGFAIGTNPSEHKAWLAHCPGVLAMARSSEPNTASSHFYFVNGQAPRYLDRIMTIFGRVVYGMNHIQSIQRTSVIDGERAVDARDHTPIISMQMMNDVPAAEKIFIEVEVTKGSVFKKRIEKRRARANEFFYKKPPPVLDVCQVPIRSRLISTM